MLNLEWRNEKRKISELVGHEKNPRKISDIQMKKLQDSISRFNFVEIPAIDQDNTILAGHQRIKAMQLIGRGEETIDVRVPNRKLTAGERDEYLIRSNKNTGEWDNELLAEFDEGMLADVGFESKELDKIFEQSEPIGQSERPTNIDYYVPTETDNYHYLNLLNTQAMPMFERKFESTRKLIAEIQQNEQSKKDQFHSEW